MYTTISDFERFWTEERKGTLRILEALTDASLAQAVGPEDRTLGRVAWHLTTAIPEMMTRTGLVLEGPAAEAPMPATASEIAEAYGRLSASLLEAIRGKRVRPEREGLVHIIGMAVLLSAVAVVAYFEIINPIQLPGLGQ